MDKRLNSTEEPILDGQGREVNFNGGSRRGRATFGSSLFIGALSYRGKESGEDRRLQILRTAEDEEQCVGDCEGESKEAFSDT